MTWCALVLVLAGCELVFPLRSPDAGGTRDGEVLDATELDAIPGVPAVMSLEPLVEPVMAHVPTVIRVVFTGDAGDRVFYRLNAGAGLFANQSSTIEGTVDLVGTSVEVQLAFTPGGVQRGTVVAEAATSTAYAPANSRAHNFDVIDIAGGYGPLGDFQMLPANQLIATRITTVGIGPAVLKIGVLAPSGAHVTFGIFDVSGTGGNPGQLEHDGVASPDINGRTELVLESATLAPGDHWLAVLFDATTRVDANPGVSPTPKARIADRQYLDGVPTVFPASNPIDGTLAIYVIGTPP